MNLLLEKRILLLEKRILLLEKRIGPGTRGKRGGGGVSTRGFRA
jgi:hypothetical protein